MTSQRFTTRDICLSNGQIIPSNTQISVASEAQSNDIPEPDVFDGLRWYHKRKACPENENSFQFSDAGSDNLYWGRGKHACYGRYFATEVIKCLLVGLLREYELKFIEGESRPKNWNFNWMRTPDINANVLIRRRS